MVARHEGEGLERDLHRPRAGAGADHEVEAVVLERGVEDLLDLRVEAVDLVDEEDLAVVEGGQEGGEVARPLDHGAGGALDRHAELDRDHVGEARLADAGRAEEQHVVEGLAARAGGLDRDAEVRDHLRLADVLVEAPRAQRDLEAEVVVDGPAGDEAVVHGGLVYRPESTRRERRSRSSKRPSPSSFRARSTPRSASGRE